MRIIKNQIFIKLTEKSKMKKEWICIIVIFVLILIVCALLYFFKFYGGLSSEQSNWGDFGSYIGGIAAIANVIVFVLLTIEIHRANKRQKDEELQYQTKLILMQSRMQRLNTVNEEIKLVRKSLYDDDLLLKLNILNQTIINELFTTSLFVFDNGDHIIDEKDSMLVAINKMKKLFPNRSQSPTEYANAVNNFLTMSAQFTTKMEFYILVMLKRESSKDSTWEYMSKIVKENINTEESK